MLAEHRSTLEKARQAERLIAERDVATRNATSATGRRSRSPPSSRRSPRRTRHRTRCRSSASAVERLRVLDGRIRELRALLSDEVDVQFDVAPEPTWRPLSRVSVALVVIGLLIAGVAGADQGARPRRPGSPWCRVSARSSRSSASCSPRVALWLRRSDRLAGPAARRRDRPPAARPLGDGGGAQGQRGEGRRSSSGRSGCADLAAAEALLAARGGARRPDRPADRPARGPRRQGADRDAADPARRGRPGDRRRRRSALEALGPIAKEPRARERLEVEVRDQEAALERAARRRGERPGPGRGERRRRRAGRRAGRAAGRLARAAGRAPAPPARLRGDAAPPSTGPSRRR